MPTNEETMAIIACARKAKNAYGDTLETDKQYELVMGWANKWFEYKKYNNEKANRWNKENVERHRETNRKYYHNNKEKVKAYQKMYYQTVRKRKD